MAERSGHLIARFLHHLNVDTHAGQATRWAAGRVHRTRPGRDSGAAGPGMPGTRPIARQGGWALAAGRRLGKTVAMTRRALVLGAGGEAGIAWEVGLLAG